LPTAFCAGVAAVVPVGSDPEEIVQTVLDAEAGRVRLPMRLVRALFPATQIGTEPPPPLSPAEVAFLRLVAGGATVATMAREAHVSQRTMYRRLDELFKRLGVESRVAAVARAYQWRLL
jgi:DNA-binding NarL/FixJ family response regulator